MHNSDQQRPGRFRRVTIAAVLGGGLALGGAGLAYAADEPTPAPSPSSEGRAPEKHQPHLEGTVKSLGDGKIMIEDHSGFTRQINIATIPDGIAVGTRVHAVGTVNADGVSLDATSVEQAPDRPAAGERPARPFGPGGKGHGPGPRPSQTS